ncbi:unnamed protein product [Rhodiola kirilowii]
MDEEGDSQQFWLHSASTGASSRPKSSSNFFGSNLLMLIVAIATLLLLLFAISSYQSSPSQILKPNSVRKSWDYLNVMLVVFAIACGVFARWNEDVGGNTDSSLEIPVEQVSNDIQLQQTSSPTSSYELRWYELPYDPPVRATAIDGGRLRRNSSSYPDLRQQSDWETTGGHEFRYYDDFEISRSNQWLERQPNGIVGRRITRRNEDPDAKVIPVDTYSSQTVSTAKSSSLHENLPSQPPRPPPSTQQKNIRVHRPVPRRERLGIENAPHTTHQQPQKDNTGDTTAIRSQTKPRRRKVLRDAPVKEETNTTRSTSESISNLIPPHSPPPAVDLTIPLKAEYTRPTPETSSLLHPPSPPETTMQRSLPEQYIEVKPEAEATSFISPPPPPSPPNVVPTIIPSDQNQKLGKKERKKSSAKKEIAMVWASIYKRKKKQHQPQQQQQQLGRADSGNYNGISQLFSEPDSTSTSQLFPPPSPAPPPPPPPPPPHNVFHSLFRKSGGNKSKKIYSVSAPPPPPPPPPPRYSFGTPPRQSLSTGKPPLPKRPSNYSKGEYGYLNNSGSQSPMFDIPRPPPLPPFNVPETKFVVRGGYAKIKSNASSRSGSPEPYEFDSDSLINESPGGEVPRAAAFCPSPDVNAKADTFIARLRGEWRMEKMNSVNEKTRMSSGPETGSG